MRILTVSRYWNPTGFIPEFCIIKTLWFVGNWGIDDEEAIRNVEMDANPPKVMHFISLIKECQELALTACDVGEFLRRRVEIAWEHGQEDLSEWSEGKRDDLYQLGNEDEKRVLNLKRLLKELIETSDQPLALPINWELVVVLSPPPFHKPLRYSACPLSVDPLV